MKLSYILVILIEVTYVAKSSDTRHTSIGWDRFEDYDQCVYGTYQTPIHVDSHVFEYIVMPAIDFSGYSNYLPPPITLTNTGRTVKLKAGKYLEGGLYSYPSITGGLLDGRYVWDSIHFHWGKSNDRGSEHVINNVSYPMEMHVIHRKTDYKTRNEALESKDGLTVLGFFFELQVEDNRRLRPIINNLKYIREPGTMTNITKSFNLFTILPRKKDFFLTYEGSLSSPPCTESVIWVVFPDPIKISFRQMEEFRTLSIPENFRSVQPLGQRKVFVRQTKRFISPEFEEFTRENVSSNIFWLKLR